MKSVELKESVEYSHKGEKTAATFVDIMPPSYKQLENFIPIKQAFIRAITDLGDSGKAGKAAPEEDDDSVITGPQVMAVLMRSSVDMRPVFVHAQELFKSGAALIGGEGKMTGPIIEKMPVPDFELLLGEYIANFIAPSLTDGL